MLGVITSHLVDPGNAALDLSEMEVDTGAPPNITDSNGSPDAPPSIKSTTVDGTLRGLSHIFEA